MEITNAEDARRNTINTLLYKDINLKELYDDIIAHIIDASSKGSFQVIYTIDTYKISDLNALETILKNKGFYLSSYEYQDAMKELYISWGI